MKTQRNEPVRDTTNCRKEKTVGESTNFLDRFRRMELKTKPSTKRPSRAKVIQLLTQIDGFHKPKGVHIASCRFNESHAENEWSRLRTNNAITPYKRKYGQSLWKNHSIYSSKNRKKCSARHKKLRANSQICERMRERIMGSINK